jgi:MFS family permease
MENAWRWSWTVVLGSSVALAYGSIFYAFSVLVTEDAAGAEFSTTTLSTAYGAFVLVSGALAALVGHLADRVGVRPLVAAGMTAGAAGMALLGRADAPWHTILVAAVLLGPAGALTFYETAFIALDRWFGVSHRARALAAVTFLGGIAGPIFLPVTGFLVDRLGWRGTTLVLASVLASGSLVTALALPKRSETRRHDAPAPAVRHLAKDRRFVLFTLSTVLVFGAIQTVFFHRVAVFTEAGIPLTTVTAWAAASSLLSLPGRWVAPHLAGRVGARRVYVAGVLSTGVAAAFGIHPTVWTMAAHFTAFGIAFGALLPIRALVMAGWYSGPAYGRILGTQWTIAAVCGSLTPAAAGWLRDATGSYGWPLALTAVIFCGAAAAALAALRP